MGRTTTCTASESEPDPPTLLVTATRTLSRPSAEYTCEAMIGEDWAVPLLEPPSPHRIVYVHGGAFAGSVSVTASFTVSPGLAVTSAPAFTDSGGAPWQPPVPESRNVLPAIGTNSQA